MISSHWRIATAALIVGGIALFFLQGKDPSRNSPLERESSLVVTSKAQGLSGASAHPSNSTPQSDSAVSSIDYAAALNAALGEPDPRKRSKLFGTLLRQWFNANPDAALVYVQQMSPSSEYTQGLLLVLEGLGKNDPKRALTLARDMAITRDQQVIYNILFDQLAHTDIKAAVNFLDLVPTGESRANAIRALATVWADKDMAFVLDWAEHLPDAADKSTALETALLILADADPGRALDLAQQFLNGDVLDRILASSLRNITADNPEAATRFVSNLPPGELKTRAALDLARALAANEPAKALTWIATLPADLQKLALNNVLDIWSKKDPVAAKEYISQLPPGAAQDAAAAHLAQQLGALDSLEAIKWAQTLSSDSARIAAFSSIASSWAKTDPAAAAQWAATLDPESPARGESIRAALSYWMLQDPAAAGKFVQTLPQADQPNAVSAMAQLYAQNNVADALAWAQSLPFDDSRQIALREVISRWADNNPADAARWVSTEPEGTLHTEHVRSVIAPWCAQDPKAAADWAQTLSPGDARDGAFNVLATQMASNNPALAAKWAESIGSTELRNIRLEQVVLAWLQTDRVSAREWLTLANVPAEMKSRLLHQ